MAFKQANKPYNNGERNWVKISQAHVDAKREIMEASLKERCFGWSYSPATMQVQSIVDWLFNPSLVGTATHGYRTYLNAHGEYVIDVTRTRNTKQKLTEPELTPTVLTELLSSAKLGTYIQLRVKLCNSDVRSKSRKPIPDTTFLIINLNKLETGELRSSSHFDSSTFRRILVFHFLFLQFLRACYQYHFAYRHNLLHFRYRITRFPNRLIHRLMTPNPIHNHFLSFRYCQFRFEYHGYPMMN